MSSIVSLASRIYHISIRFETKRGLVRLISFLFLFALIGYSIPQTNSQTRPRRVGDNKSSASSSQSPPSSAQPPILRGSDVSQSPATQNRGSAQERLEEVAEGDIVRVNTTLVTIPVSVMDRDGKYIPNLRKEDFRIWDDGVEQQPAYFASTEQPFTVALMIDTSGSTHFKLEEMQDAAISFVNQLQENDRIMVVSFDDKIRFLLDSPTSDRAALRQAILKTRTGGGTRLYDAVDQVINQRLNHIQGRKAIVLFTDGVDTTSRSADYDDNVRDAEELDALIYPVQFDTYGDLNSVGSWPRSPRGPSSGASVLGNILGGIILGGGRRGIGGWPGGPIVRSPGSSREDYRRGNQYLHDLADRTGARVYDADQDLLYAFAQVAEELRRQYSLGYYPKAAGQPGERHQIKVRTNRQDLVVRARTSYIYKSVASLGVQNPQQSPPILRKSP